MRQLAISLFTALSLPIMGLNLLGGVVAGIWLLTLHRWGDFATGLLVPIACYSVLFPILLLPSGLVFAGLGPMAERGKIWVVVGLTLVANLWSSVVMLAWCLLVFVYMIAHSHGHLGVYSVWAYGTASGPWAAMAQSESRSNPASGSWIAATACQFGCLAAVVGILAFHAGPTAWSLLPYLAPFAALATLAETALLIALGREAKAEFTADETADLFT